MSGEEGLDAVWDRWWIPLFIYCVLFLRQDEFLTDEEKIELFDYLFCQGEFFWK